MTDMTADQLAALIATAVAQALAATKAPTPTKTAKAAAPVNTTVDAKTNRQLEMDVLVVRSFARAGFKSVTPRVDTKTFNKWMAEGYRVRPGEKSIRCRQFRLFHKSQVEFVGIPPKPEGLTEAQAEQFAEKVKAMQRNAPQRELFAPVQPPAEA